MTPLIAGFVLGTAGSVHCLSMCGPLVAAVAPVGPRAAWYHAGRGTVYVALGLGAGAIGQTLAVAGFGRVLASLMAAVIVLEAVARLRGSRWNWLPAWATYAWQSISVPLRTYATVHPRTGGVALGVMNGLVPCGLVYTATAAAVGLGAVIPALAFMSGFAIGTTPVLVAGAMSGRGLTRRMPALARLAPVVLLLVAMLLVVRGFQVPDGGTHVH